MTTDDRVQSVRNAWTNALRAEVLRVGRTIPEVARVAAVGMWIATYTDADGSNAFPARDTLATLSGCSQETVTRAVKVLMGVGLLTRKRRPNASTVYQLLIPTGRPDWAAHIHHMTDTRQRRARQLEKERLVAELTRTASADAIRTASAVGVPDSVRGGGSEPSEEAPDSVRGRPRKASPDAVRTASAAGVYQYPPTSGRDPLPDHDSADHSPKPQTRAGEAAERDQSEARQLPRCPECAQPIVPDPRRPDRTIHAACQRRLERHSA
ncbi:helix-turn-helix domain-containing protein [Streptomyces sp. NPDC046900]|uniref:helix-turn-helix domain-containing protein n=1 Tax=Streptomyces sp. NPDC046900 TaxID=3155473 RepID=UPI0033E4201B